MSTCPVTGTPANDCKEKHEILVLCQGNCHIETNLEVKDSPLNFFLKSIIRHESCGDVLSSQRFSALEVAIPFGGFLYLFCLGTKEHCHKGDEL